MSESEAKARRVYTDEQRLCDNCFAQGGPGVRLMRCKGCEIAWYCGHECQKAGWKIHKAMCKQLQQTRAGMPEALAQHQTDLQVWVRRNAMQLNNAGNEALLQHKDYLDGHLLDTHVLSVQLKKTPAGDFVVESAEVQPHEELKKAYRLATGGDAEYARAVETNTQSRINAAKVSGRVIAGIMWIMIWCHPAFQVHPLCIPQDIIDSRKKTRHNDNWVEKLKSSAAGRDDALWRTKEGSLNLRRVDKS